MEINVNGYKIVYKESGSGDNVVVMLQGWGTEMSLYDSVAASINDRCRFIQFDLPGFGGSDEPKEAWGVDDFADFFEDFMEALGIKRATLIGHSYGGRMIIKLANRKNLSFEIDRIVLIDSAGILPVKTFKQKFKIRKYKILKSIVNLPFIYAICPNLIDEWKNKQGSADYRNASPIMKQCMVKAVNEDLSQLLPGIKKETLLIWGDKDTATPLSDAKLMEEKIPDSGLAIIPGTGHFCFVEQPVVFRNIMRAYFKIGE